VRDRSLRQRAERAFALFGAILAMVLVQWLVGGMRLGEEHVFDRIAESAANRYLKALADEPAAQPVLPSEWNAAIGLAALPPELRDPAARLAPGNHEVDIDDARGEREYLIAVRPLAGRADRLYLVLDVTEIEYRDDLHIASGSVLVILVLLAAGGGALAGRRIAQRVVRPLTDLTAVVRSAPLDALPERLRELRTEGETAVLADTLSDALQRVRAHVEREKRFTRNASHELRTPVTVLKGATELLGHRIPPDDTHLRPLLERISRATADMEATVETFLWLAREQSQLSSGQADLRGGQECDVGGIVRRTVEAHRHRLAGKPVEVRLDLAWELTVRAPASVLGSALGNLVANAFEHVERGEVTIGTTPGAIFVEDTGAGIATDLLGDVRHPFVRGDSSSGHGLGLAIIEELCQRFGWTLSLASDGSRGTRAQIELGESVVTARFAKDTRSSQPRRGESIEPGA
jgi:signal transduction histidine kinase